MALPTTDDLIQAASEVRQQAYAPYSGYKVGAAVLDEFGRIHVGCNVENISYGGAICAERSAVTRMIATGGREVKQVAVVTQDGGTPCGFCRQVLMEFTDDPAQVVVFIVTAGDPNTFTSMSLADLVPFAFKSDQVARTESGQ